MQACPRDPVWVYAHPSMETLAEAVVQRCSDYSEHELIQRVSKLPRQLSQQQERRRVILKKTIQWEKFHDGFPNLFIEDVRKMAGKDVIFIGSFHSPEVIFEQLSIIYAIPRYLARSFTFLLPYFPTGTMERVDTEGQIATAKTLATLLSSTPLTARGPAQILVFDIHALQERFYFSESVIPRLESAVPLLQREIQLLKLDMDEDTPLTIAFPDDGAFKRFHHMFSETPTVICNKVRDGNRRFVKVKEGDPTGCHVIIVDDLIQTGGTLIECIKVLRAAGAKKVSCFVTHAVFPKESWKTFRSDDPEALGIDTFWITDSVPHAALISKHPPFKLLTLADMIVDVLWGYDLVQ